MNDKELERQRKIMSEKVYDAGKLSLKTEPLTLKDSIGLWTLTKNGNGWSVKYTGSKIVKDIRVETNKNGVPVKLYFYSPVSSNIPLTDIQQIVTMRLSQMVRYSRTIEIDVVPEPKPLPEPTPEIETVKYCPQCGTMNDKSMVNCRKCSYDFLNSPRETETKKKGLSR